MPQKKNKYISLSLIICFLILFLSNNVLAEQKHEADFSDLSDYYSTKLACKSVDEDCASRPEYKFYLKMYDIYYLYKNKYNVTLDLPLLMATLFYNSDQMSVVMEMNLSNYNRDTLVNSDWNPTMTTTLDWDYNYESLPNYLVYNDSSYDMQILAKNMVTKTTEQSCVDKDGKTTKSEKVKDTEEDLSCEDGETLKKGSSTYALDYDKYDDFLLKYIEYKYYIRRMVDESCLVKDNGENITLSVNVSEADGNIFVGDSRNEGLCATITGKDASLCKYSSNGVVQDGNDYYIAEGSQGYSWFDSTAISAINSILDDNPDSTFNIIINMGVNGLLGDVDKYVSKYNELIIGDWKNQNVVLVSVNPVDETKESQYGYTTKNSDIETFNDKIKDKVTGTNVLYCDVYGSIKDDFSTFDGLHYTSDTYQDIYDSTMNCIDSGVAEKIENATNSCSFSKIGGFEDGNIIYYNQGDYSAYSYGGYGTIKSHGCGPSSLAIVISSMTGEEHDPVEITNHVCGIGGCSPEGTYISAIGQTIEDYGFHYEQTTDSQKVYDALASGDALVIVSMGPGHFTTGGHYITLTAANGSNMVTVADPGNRSNNHEWDLSLIASESNYGFWIVTR